MELVVKNTVEIQHNMQSVKTEIQNQLKQYDIVVTDDTVKDTKKLMADINKNKQAFSDACKKYLTEIEAPVKAFKSEQKEVESLFVDARLRLSSQVDKFESKKLDEIADIVINTKNVMCNEKGINQDRVSVEDLIKLSAFTTTNKLAKTTLTAIENKILLVEDEILREKQAEQDRETEKERIRQEAIQQERLRVEQEREKKLKKEVVEEVNQLEPEPVIQDDGKTLHKVVVEFSVTAPSHIPYEAIKNKVSEKLSSFGLKEFVIK